MSIDIQVGQECDPFENFGLSDFDIRHNFVFNYTWELPFGKDLTGAAGALAHGWLLHDLLPHADGLLRDVLANPSGPVRDAIAAEVVASMSQTPTSSTRPSRASSA